MWNLSNVLPSKRYMVRIGGIIVHYANTYLEKPVVPDVKITGEGNTKVLKCMLNTGSDIYQGACKKRGSTLKQEYGSKRHGKIRCKQLGYCFSKNRFR